MTNPTFTLRAFIGGATLFIASAVAAQSIDAIDWKPGYKWKYKVVDGFTKLESGTTEKVVLSVADGAYLTKHVGTAGQSDESVQSDGSHIRAMPVGNGMFAYNQVKFPLAVGNKWESTYFYKARSNGALGKNESECKVAEREKVASPAGEFDSYRIECRGYWYANGFSGRMEDTLWYAPNVKWLVKARYKFWQSGALASQDEHSLTEYQNAP